MFRSASFRVTGSLAHGVRFQTAGWLTGGLHLVIIIIAAQLDTPAAWPWALAAMAGVSFFAWTANFRRYRQIHDLPTSKVASAAQGYVELFGHAENIEGAPVVSKLTGLPCCWYRYTIERKGSDDKWEYADSGESNDHFFLVDDTGQCVISPEGAEIITSGHETWEQGEYRYTEWLLPQKSRLYAIGEFSTSSGAVLELDERRDVSELLADWKQDRAELVKRFDLNDDGNVDLKEWELARLQARREVRRRHAEFRTRDGVHLLRKPRDGRLFLLADQLPEKLGRRFALWSTAHLVFFFAAGIAALYFLL
jgi:hypothetical protein